MGAKITITVALAMVAGSTTAFAAVADAPRPSVVSFAPASATALNPGFRKGARTGSHNNMLDGTDFAEGVAESAIGAGVALFVKSIIDDDNNKNNNSCASPPCN